MTAADGVLAVIAAAAVAYTVLGGADFGGGVWDLLAGPVRRDEQRALIATTMGPVWEANHVWLVFVLIGGFSGFPVAFGRLSILLAVPLALALLGIVLRGAAFVFRQYGATGAGPAVRGTLAWGRVFAIASTITPVTLGVCVGATATGRVGGWFPAYAGALALAFCAYLAAVFLCHEARSGADVVWTDERSDEGAESRKEDDVLKAPDPPERSEGNAAQFHVDTGMAELFRRRALLAGLVAGALALLGPVVLALDAPRLTARLTGAGAPLLLASAAGGGLSLLLLARRRYRAARLAAGVAVAAVVAGAIRAMYPVVVPPDLTVARAAAPADTLPVTLAILVAGFAVTVPSLVVLLRTFGSRPQRTLR
jgi:cytochrome d ubiquinol oxidase subunit II